MYGKKGGERERGMEDARKANIRQHDKQKGMLCFKVTVRHNMNLEDGNKQHKLRRTYLQ